MSKKKGAGLEEQEKEIEKKYQEALQKKEALEKRLLESIKAKMAEVVNIENLEKSSRELREMSQIFTKNKTLTPEERAEKDYQSSRARNSETLKPQFSKVLDELQGKDGQSSTAKIDKVLGNKKVPSKALKTLGPEAQMDQSKKAQQIAGVGSYDRPNKSNFLQRALKNFRKLFSRPAKGTNASAIGMSNVPNNKSPGQGRGK